MRFTQGRSVIDHLQSDRQLERVTASREFADRIVVTARQKLVTAEHESRDDPDSAYELLYEAARLALTAILENQGLRPTTSGGHTAPYEAARAQLDPPMGATLRPYDRMRRRRHAVGYPTPSTPPATTAEVLADLPLAAAIVDLAARVLDDMSPLW
jgi:hypothetical protein